ncbi:hypothetical protein [Ornithinibacillus californiensis]|uniref:hypothetical protein n=1 Tax=Ornithinibacillus californiensis TaxID=161536 RepID=UPI00064E0220|nr:hypothetical protein [Ornithinibacillus californiensis]
MKKLEGYAAEVIKDIIRDGDAAFELDGKRYQVISLESPITTVKEDVEADPGLEKKLHQAKKDILNNQVYSTDEVLEMIDQGEL